MVTVQLDERAHASLRLYKALAGYRNYSDAVVNLMDEAGYEVPEENLSDQELLEKVFG